MAVFAHVLIALLASTPTTVQANGDVKPAAAVAVVRQVALPVATGVKAKLGTPSCPSAVPNRVGGVFQCTVAIGDATVPFLVHISTAALTATQLWAVIPATLAEGVAGAGAKCDARKMLTGPPGSTIACIVAGRSVPVRISTLAGAVARV